MPEHEPRYVRKLGQRKISSKGSLFSLFALDSDPNVSRLDIKRALSAQATAHCHEHKPPDELALPPTRDAMQT